MYAAKKQQVLRQIRQEAAGTELAIVKQHAQGSMSILDILSVGNAPPATQQLLKAVGAAAAKIWTRERLLPTIARKADGSLSRVWFEPGSNTAERAVFVPEEEPHLFAEACMKYSLAYKGGYEASDRANFDTWTYPARTGAEVLHEAVSRVQAMTAAT